MRRTRSTRLNATTTARRHIMTPSARHIERRGTNVAIAGGLLAFCLGTYAYTMRKVRTDEVDDELDRRAGKGAR